MSTKLSNIVKDTFSRIGFIFKEKKKVFILIFLSIISIVSYIVVINILGKPSSLFSACLFLFLVVFGLFFIYLCYSGMLVVVYRNLKNYDDNKSLSHSFKWWFKDIVFFSFKYLAVSLILFIPNLILLIYLFWVNKIGSSVPELLKIFGSIFCISYGIMLMIVQKLVVPVLLFVSDGSLIKKIRLAFQLFNLHKFKIIWYFFIFAAFSFLITSCIGMYFVSISDELSFTSTTSFLCFVSIITSFRVFMSLILTPSLVMSLYQKLSKELIDGKKYTEKTM